MTLNANSLDLTKLNVDSKTDVFVTPRTAATTISLNGAGTSDMNFDTASLSHLNADSDGNFSGKLVIGDAAAGTGAIDIGAWDLSGRTASVEVYGGSIGFTSDLTWDTGINLSFVARTSDLNLTNNFTKSGTGDSTLTLKAAGDIFTGSGFSATSTGGKLNLILWSDSDANGSGAIALQNPTIHTNGGTFVAGGGLDDGSNGGVAADGRPDGFARGNATYNDGMYLGGNDITTGNGAILLRGQGDNISGASQGIHFSNGTITTTGGNLTATGIGGLAGGSGLSFTNGGIIQTATGDLLFTGSSPGGGAGIVGTNQHITSTGTGTLSFVGTATAAVDGNAGILLANAGMLIDSAYGDISLTGVANTGAGNSDDNGIVISSTASITSTGIGAGAARIILSGTGGNGFAGDNGIIIDNATLTSTDGAISLSGSGRGNGGFGDGIYLNNNAQINSTGIAPVTLNGTGSGTGGQYNLGVFFDNNSAIHSVSGAMLLNGTGGGNGTDRGNRGVEIANGSQLVSTGLGGSAATITFNGTGGSGTTSNDGVMLYAGSITTGDGAILLNGSGNGSGATNYGVELLNASGITSTGLGTVTLTGTGSLTGTDTNNGVQISDAGTLLTSATAAISLNGLGGGNSTDNRGIGIAGGAQITSTGLGASAATISLNGTGGAGTDRNDGVTISGAGTAVSSIDGDILLTGQTLGTGDNNNGVSFYGSGAVTSTGATAQAANIAINGTGGGTGNGGVGVYSNFSGNSISSTTGSITLIGTGANGNTFGDGINWSSGDTISTTSGAITLTGVGNGPGSFGNGLAISGIVESTGAGVVGDITLSGTGSAAGGNNNIGIGVSGTIRSVDAHIVADAQGGVSSAGLAVYTGGLIESTGNGDLTLSGTAGATSAFVGGVYLDHGTIHVVNGDVTMNGLGNAAAWGYGIESYGGVVSSTGIGAGAGTITLDGTGSGGGSLWNNHGIVLLGTGVAGETSITSVDGAITLNGTGGGVGGGNNGIQITAGSQISSTGITASAATITLNGTGSSTGTSDGHGIYITDTDSLITSVKGAIALNGTDSGTGDNNRGIDLIDGAQITSTGVGAGAAAITLSGIGSSGGVNANMGVIFENSGTGITSVDGTVSVTGIGGNGSGSGNNGVELYNGAAIATTGNVGGNVILSGSSGLNGAATNDDGITFISGGSIAAHHGDITATGTGNDVNLSEGISFANGVNTIASDSGNILLTAIAGGPTRTGFFIGGGTNTIGNAGATGDITVVTNSVDWSNLDVSTQNNITVKPYTAGTTIGLAGGAGTLNLNASELALLHADVDANGSGELMFGTYNSGSGDVHVGAYNAWNSDVRIMTDSGQIYIDGAQDFGWAHAFRLNTNADIHLNADITQVTALHIFGTDGTTSIGIGGAVGTINLSDAELDHIVSAGWFGIGWNGIANPLSIGAYNNWHANNIEIGSSTSVTVTGLQASAAGSDTNFLFDTATSITGGIDLSAAAGNNYVRFLAPVALTGDTVIKSAGTGAVVFDSTVNGAHDLSLAAGGNIVLGGIVGGATALTNVALNADGAVTAAGAVNATNNITLATHTAGTSLGIAGGAGAAQFDVPLLANLHSDSDATGGGQLVIGRTDGGGTMTMGAYAGWNSDLTVQSGAGVISVAGAQNFGAHNVTFNTNGDIDLSAGLTGSGNLTIAPTTAGTGMGFAGGSGAVDLSAADLGNISNGWSLITFGSLTDTGVMNLAAHAWADPVSFLSGATGQIRINGAQTAVAGSDTAINFTGPILLGADVDISLAAGDRGITFNGPVSLGANANVHAAGIGGITFANTLDGAFDLDVRTQGDILFNGDVGGLTRLGNVTVDPHLFTSVVGMRVLSFALTAGTGDVTMGGTGLDSTGGISIDTDGNIAGSYLGTLGHLYSGTGLVNATVNFANLDINGAGATLLAGNIGAAGVADQAMANRITINSILMPAPLPAYTFAGFIIGAGGPPPAPPGGGGGGGGVAGAGSSLGGTPTPSVPGIPLPGGNVLPPEVPGVPLPNIDTVFQQQGYNTPTVDTGFTTRMIDDISPNYSLLMPSYSIDLVYYGLSRDEKPSNVQSQNELYSGAN